MNSWRIPAAPGSMLTEILALTASPLAMAQLASQPVGAAQPRCERVQTEMSDKAEQVAAAANLGEEAGQQRFWLTESEHSP